MLELLETELILYIQRVNITERGKDGVEFEYGCVTLRDDFIDWFYCQWAGTLALLPTLYPENMNKNETEQYPLEIFVECTL